MKKTVPLRWIKSVLVLSFACFSSFTATAQNYYPADIGNMWILESSDGERRSIYTLEGPEVINGEEHILLKIKTEELSTGKAETDQYYLTLDTEVIKLHRIILEDTLATLTADFRKPATFFPRRLLLGDKWEIETAVKAELMQLTISGESITDLEVVGFEDVITSVGTFENCAKIRLEMRLQAGGFLSLNSVTYQWFAPEVGPVQYQNSDGLRFTLTSYNLLTPPEVPDTLKADTVVKEDVHIEPPPLPYDVTGDGVVNILDLTFVAVRFGSADFEADVTGDGIVNILDLVHIAQNLSN